MSSNDSYCYDCSGLLYELEMSSVLIPNYLERRSYHSIADNKRNTTTVAGNNNAVATH